MARYVKGRNGGMLKVPEKGDPSPNAKGRPPGSLSSKTVIRRWLEAIEKAKNPITGQIEALTQLDIITLKQLEKARKGDTTAFKELLDRMEGRPQQKIEQDLNVSGFDITLNLNE
jgi:hypothetical protein